MMNEVRRAGVILASEHRTSLEEGKLDNCSTPNSSTEESDVTETPSAEFYVVVHIYKCIYIYNIYVYI